jgi:membrane-associated protease RseP (regulator of RpoE activity)
MSPHSLLSRVGTGTKLIAIHQTLGDAEKFGIVTRFPGVLAEPLPGSIAEKAGIQSGDVILAINGSPMKLPGDVSQFISASTLESHVFHIQRGDKELDITLRPQSGKIGAYVLPNMTAIRYQYSFFTAMGHGMVEMYQQIGFSLRTFGAILTTSFSETATTEEKKEATDGIGGPVAIGRVFV